MNAWNLAVWVVLPYVAMAIFVGGHVWRYRFDKFGWTTRSTQILESRWLAWGSNLFHFGALAAIAGHILGLLIPAQVTAFFGVSEEAYHLLSAIAGSAAGIACVVGFGILVFRRIYFVRVRRTTSRMDVATYLLLALVIGLGMVETVGFGALGGGYDYRSTVGVWFRGLFYLSPQPDLMAGAPLVYQLHAVAAWALFALWPFGRLVHAWSVPWQYVGRPYVLYRRRYMRG